MLPMLPTGATDPSRQYTATTYDALGRVATATDFNGTQTTYAYEPQSGRLSGKSVNANNGVSYTYNSDGSRKTATRVTGGVSVTTTYAYYPNGGYRQGRLWTVANSVGTISYDYDVAGNKIGMQPPSLAAQGKSIAYGYDALNRLVSVTHPDGAVTRFGYDNVGNRQTVTRLTASGAMFSTTAYTYDALNRLTNQVNTAGTGALVSGYLYQLRADGKRLSVAESGPSTSNSTTSYTYDDAGKLTQESGTYGTVAYAYDNVGNRLTRTVSGSTALANGQTVSTYDANDRLTSGAHSYDFDGNELSVNGQGASYDFENHLIALSGGTTYTYDADGSRVGVTAGGATTGYVVDASLPYASVVEEYSGSTLTARYDYGDDLVRMDRASGVYYYLYDGLGSTRQLVGTGGSVTDSYYYDGFGTGLSHTGNTVNPFLFNAQQFDVASGDYYLRARYYDPTSGRFLSQDPYSGSNEDPISLHRYLYVSDDPVNGADPTGKYDGRDHTAVEDACDPIYDIEHPEDAVFYGKVQYYDANGWTGYQRVATNPAFGKPINFSFQKPDIFNADGHQYLDYKPLSDSGKIDATHTLADYAEAFGPKPGRTPTVDWFTPDTDWQPPVFVRANNGVKYWLFNDGNGIIFYESETERRKRFNNYQNLTIGSAIILSGSVVRGIGLALFRAGALAALGSTASTLSEESELAAAEVEAFAEAI